MLDESTGNFSANRNLYDWYQNTTHVIINIMIKNLRENDVRVRLIDEMLDVTCSLANGSLFKLHFNLFKPIFVADSSWSVTPSKLEVKLKKTDRKRWQSLEVVPEKGGKRTPAVAGIVAAGSPTAKKFVSMSSSDCQTKSDGKPKYDWYQTELYVVVTVMIRNLNADNVEVVFGENTADLTCKLENDSEYNLNLKLSNEIIPKDSSFKITTSKVELKMKKIGTVRWESLEIDSKHEPCNTPDKKAIQVETKKDFNSKKWDKIINEIEEEEKKTENFTVEDFFSDIYKNLSDESKRAMQKSFQESNGTVLNTNWNQVSKSKVETKPPDGCEFKKWC